MEYLKACDVCGSTSFGVHGVSVGPDDLHNILVKCGGCGIFFMNPRATREELAAYYDRVYDDHHLFEERHQAPVLEGARRAVAAFRPLKPSGRVLDIGCGPGLFLKVAREAGYDAIGVDLSRDAAEYGRTHFGLEILASTVEDAKFPDASFDVVYCWHLIEHVHDLPGFLRELHRILAPGGVLVIGTENYSNLIGRVMRYYYMVSGGWVPRIATDTAHTYLFGPRTLCRVLERFGFDIASCHVYQDNKRNQFFENARSRNPLKAAVKYALYFGAFQLSRALPIGEKLSVTATKRA